MALGLLLSLMGEIQNYKLRKLHGQIGDIIYEISKVQFSQFNSPESWRPSINAYRCQNCYMICVDLAGMKKSEIDIRVEPRRLLLRGVRQVPEPAEDEPRPVQILTMEIDHGPFERDISFPTDVEPGQVTAEQRNGLLWIYLPIRSYA
jgi:HSP20 family protein